jgi:Tfp pilus assembly protein PilX
MNHARTILPRLRRRLADERGMSLVLALAFMTIFSVTTAALVNELVLNQTASTRDQKMVSSLSAAEAELNFAEQWVQQNDPNDAIAPDPGSGGSTTYVYPTQSSGTNKAQVALNDSVSSTTWFYTGNPITGATNTGWWAHKYSATSTTCTSYQLTTNCWVVDGHAKIGLSSREVQVVLTSNNALLSYTPSTTTLVSTMGATSTGTQTVVTSNPVTLTSTDLASWQGGFADTPSGGCVDLSGGASFTESFYTKGNLCMSGGTKIIQPSGHTVKLYVGGSFWSANSSAYAGGTTSTMTTKLTYAHVSSSCYAGTYPSVSSPAQCAVPTSAHIAVSDANGVRSSGDNCNYFAAPACTFPTKPAVDSTKLDALYQSASPGPKHPCGTGSTGTSPTFDTDSTRNNTTTSNAPWPQNGPDYDCKSTDSAGDSTEMKWVSSTRTLTFSCSTPSGGSCDPTIFFDGNLNPGSNDYVKYVGRATMYFNGTISLHNSDSMCPWFSNNSSGSACTPTESDLTTQENAWSPDANYLTLVAGNAGSQGSTTTCTSSANQAQVIGSVLFAGSLYVNGCLYTSNGASILGAFIADYVEFAGSGAFWHPNYGASGLPSGTPQNYITTTSYVPTTVYSTITTTALTVTSTPSTSSTPNATWGQANYTWRQIN